MSLFVLEGRYSFTLFQSDGEFIPNARHSYRESTFTLVKFSFRNNKLL